MARTIDLTGDDEVLAETLSPHDPRRRAVFRGGETRGAELVVEIQKLAAEGLGTAQIVKRAKCSRAYVRKVLTRKPKEKRIPEKLLQSMVEMLRAGSDPAALFDALPEVAGLFKARGTPESARDERQRVLASLRVLISSGGRAADGPAKALYLARQAGRVRRRS